MRPLTIITTYNRKSETARTLAGLCETTDLADIDLVIVDNGSTDGTRDLLREWYLSRNGDGGNVRLVFQPENIGCPKALNWALLRYRRPGQPVVKIDNDVVMLTRDWVQRVPMLIEAITAMRSRMVAMVSADYAGATDGKVLDHGQLRWIDDGPWSEWRKFSVLSNVIGHCVWHSGPFMDAVGFYDVLSPQHLYGFEDLILSHKASRLGWDMLTWEGWQIENIQRHNSLGDGRNAHVEALRPIYKERVQALSNGGPIWTNHLGEPAEPPGELGHEQRDGRIVSAAPESQ